MEMLRQDCSDLAVTLSRLHAYDQGREKCPSDDFALLLYCVPCLVCYATTCRLPLDSDSAIRTTMAKGSRLIPTEATPVATPAASRSPSPALPRAGKPRKANATSVAHGFLAVPVRVHDSEQYIFLRRQQIEDGEAGSSSASKPANTIFAVNLPFGSTEDAVKRGVQDLLNARQQAAASLIAKGKGKAVEGETSLAVEIVEFVVPPLASRKALTLLEEEGIVKPEDLLAGAGNAQGSSDKTAAPIHPLFISSDITLQEALAHIRPSPSTLKAHITLSSARAVQLLLAEKPSWQVTEWPSTSRAQPAHQGISATLSTNLALLPGQLRKGKKAARTTDEILHDLSRPSLDNVKLHVDTWMAHFDSTAPVKPTPAAKLAQARAEAAAAAAAAAEPKSKRQQKREAAAKAEKVAALERQRAIKKRRLYDDDFKDPAADEDGWITVTADHGVKGRSGIDGVDDDEIEDEEEMRKAELEGFATGKRSVGIARRAFVKQQEEELKAEREKERKTLNAKLGITEADDGTSASTAGLPGVDEDDSRGGGRGKRKKKSRGIEVNMYGFHKREENKQSMW